MSRQFEDDELALHPVGYRCDRCGAEHVVTRSRCQALRGRGRDDGAAAALALDEERLSDLASIARASEEAGPSPRAFDDGCVDAPPSVRAAIRSSVPPATIPSADHARSGIAIGLAAVAVVGALALAHAALGTRADAATRAVPAAPARGPVTAMQIVGSMQSPATRAADIEAVPRARVTPRPAATARTGPPPVAPSSGALAAPKRSPRAAEAPSDPAVKPAPVAEPPTPVAAPPVPAPGGDTTLLDAMREAVKNGR